MSFLFFISVIVVSEGIVRAEELSDQVAQESGSAITLVDGPKYVTPPQHQPSAKPSISIPDKTHNALGIQTTKRPSLYNVKKYLPRPYLRTKPIYFKKTPPKIPYNNVVPLQNHQHQRQHFPPSRDHQIMFAASTGKPTIVKPESPKFNLPVQTINGVRNYDIKPPKLDYKSTTISTTTTTATTEKPKRNKRIWPKHILDRMNMTTAMSSPTTHNNITLTNVTITNNAKERNETDHVTSASIHVQVRYINSTSRSTTVTPPRVYRRVVRIPKHKSITSHTTTMTPTESNEWIPLIPSYHKNTRRLVSNRIKRADNEFTVHSQTPGEDRRTLYLSSYGLVPLGNVHNQPGLEEGIRKNIRKRKRHLKPNLYSGFSGYTIARPSNMHVIWRNLEHEQQPQVVTKIKHHHHHHHHKYVKTVEKPVQVPVKIEVPKPYPVPVEKKIPVPVEKIIQRVVEKKVPYPVPIEKKVPYPIEIKVPQVFPVKIVEKEYVPKPYPIVHHVPVIKQVEVKVPHPVPVRFEKKVPYPVQVKVPVPVDRPVPVPIHIEKKVPVAVPFKVLVPQPYPVETRVPYPVEVKVKEPVEVIKHVQVPVKVPVPQPIHIKVPHPVPVTVEKKVPYPVEVEKKIPVPIKIYIPKPVTVEKKVPVYISKPYLVERKVPVPVEVPIQVPVYLNDVSPEPQIFSHSEPTPYGSSVGTDHVASDITVTRTPHHTVTYHGNRFFTGFSDRSDVTTPTSAISTSS
ncbi:hypothetical protein EVAR_44863_1 [Eumeta japonica]|uniref:Zinc finger protein 512B n=1 Tax=Eumeta variegata TaxID=151549 RepID=A0A4C1Y9T4_EUMVA|nr:hypothetical protein EVAR_44863_1 [Eumeta japonica]